MEDKRVSPLEIVRERIALYENAKVEMALYEQKIFEKKEWIFDGSPSLFKATPYEMDFRPPSEEKKEKIDCVLDELKLIEKEMMEDDRK